MQENIEARELQVRRAAEDRHLWLRKSRYGFNDGEFSLAAMCGTDVIHGFKALEDVDEWLKNAGSGPDEGHIRHN